MCSFIVGSVAELSCSDFIFGKSNHVVPFLVSVTLRYRVEVANNRATRSYRLATG